MQDATLPSVSSQATSQVRGLIASNLDRAITDAGMTNREVAESIQTGVIRPTGEQVWKWRRGRHMPSTDALVALADLLFDGDVSALYAQEEQAA